MSPPSCAGLLWCRLLPRELERRRSGDLDLARGVVPRCRREGGSHVALPVEGGDRTALADAEDVRSRAAALVDPVRIHVLDRDVAAAVVQRLGVVALRLIRIAELVFDLDRRADRRALVHRRAGLGAAHRRAEERRRLGTHDLGVLDLDQVLPDLALAGEGRQRLNLQVVVRDDVLLPLFGVDRVAARRQRCAGRDQQSEDDGERNASTGDLDRQRFRPAVSRELLHVVSLLSGGWVPSGTSRKETLDSLRRRCSWP